MPVVVDPSNHWQYFRCCLSDVSRCTGLVSANRSSQPPREKEPASWRQPLLLDHPIANTDGNLPFSFSPSDIRLKRQDSRDLAPYLGTIPYEPPCKPASCHRSAILFWPRIPTSEDGETCTPTPTGSSRPGLGQSHSPCPSTPSRAAGRLRK